MRVHLHKNEATALFNDLSALGYDVKTLSRKIGYHERTIRDWRRGKYLLPREVYIRCLELLGAPEDSYLPTYVNDIELRRAAGRLGGKAQWARNGSIGTIEHKKLGGILSYQKRKMDKYDIFYRNTIRKPIAGVDLAEFIGICMGDGCITSYQVVISFNSVDDLEYMHVVKELIVSLFGIDSKVQFIKNAKCVNLVISSVELVEHLQYLGLPKGNKLRAGLNIPSWITANQEYTNACVRGLFDTDGCIYLETHYSNGKIYAYPRLSFVSASAGLRDSVRLAVEQNDICAKIRMNRSVNIEKFTDIEKYFRIIGSSNPKHWQRYMEFGGVG